MKTAVGSGEFVRLHLGESPFGPSPLALKAAQQAVLDMNVYPDPSRTAVIEALAEHWRLPASRIAVANGSDELVLLSSLSIGSRERPGLVTEGTFPGYRTCLEATGRGCVGVPLRGTSLDVEAFAEQLPGCSIGYICNPHNPGASALSRSQMNLLVRVAGEAGVPLIFDEAYMEFRDPGCPQALDYFDTEAPVVALRTFSKAYGLAGLRIGYALGAVAPLTALRRAQRTMPFSVNRVAQAAALAALADQHFLEGVRQATAAKRAWFCAELECRGWHHLPSVTNFVAVEVGESQRLRERLAADYRILVHDAGVFGFPGYVRVALGTPDQLAQLLDALDDIDSGQHRLARGGEIAHGNG